MTLAKPAAVPAEAPRSHLLPVWCHWQMGVILAGPCAPAAWCNITGMRPSAGRVPSWPTKLASSPLSVHGPMARTVADLALFFQAIAGPDPRSPIAIEQNAELFSNALERDFAGVRIAYSNDLGYLPVDPVVTKSCESAREVFKTIGCLVDDAHPNFRGASDIFKTLRAEKYAIDRAYEFEHHRDELKQTVVDNIIAGHELDGLAPALGTRAAERAVAPRERVHGRLRVYGDPRKPGTSVPGKPGNSNERRRAGYVYLCRLGSPSSCRLRRGAAVHFGSGWLY